MLVVLGGGLGQKIFLENIFSRKIPFVLIDRNPNAPCKDLAQSFLNASIYDYEQCKQALINAEIKPSQIISFATGQTGKTVFELQKFFGLKTRSPLVLEAAINKFFLSRILTENQFPCPQVFKDKPIYFPAIAKPVCGSGGAEVKTLNSYDEVKTFLNRNDFIVQEKIKGEEVIFFIFAVNGKVHTFLTGKNIFNKNDSWQSPIGNLIKRDVNNEPLKLANDLIKAFNLQNDFMVAEAIIKDGKAYIIDVEINALSPFNASKYLDNGELIDLLVDIYLDIPPKPNSQKSWLAGNRFVYADKPENLKNYEHPMIVGSDYSANQNPTPIKNGERTIFIGGQFTVSGSSFEDVVQKIEEATKP